MGLIAVAALAVRKKSNMTIGDNQTIWPWIIFIRAVRSYF